MNDLNQLWADEMNGKVPKGTYHKELRKQYPLPKKDERVKEIEERWDYPNADKLDWNNAKDDIDSLLSRIKELQQDLDREITYKDALEQAEVKIRELEERIQLAEATRADALAYAKGYKSELAKWTSPHEDSELRRMKEQSQQPSLSAKQAYINALEWTIKHQGTNIKELEERQKWIDEVARPNHPDDERPWCSAYLDQKFYFSREQKRVKELEEAIEEYLNDPEFDTNILSELIKK